jgi:hypothetical protein
LEFNSIPIPINVFEFTQFKVHAMSFNSFIQMELNFHEINSIVSYQSMNWLSMVCTIVQSPIKLSNLFSSLPKILSTHSAKMLKIRYVHCLGCSKEEHYLLPTYNILSLVLPFFIMLGPCNVGTTTMLNLLEKQKNYIIIGRVLFARGISQAKNSDWLFWEEKIHAADGKAQACTQGALLFFLLSLGEEGVDFSSVFPSSQCVSTTFPWVSNGFPSTFHYVPQVPNVLPNPFYIASHFCPIRFGKCCPPFIYIGEPYEWTHMNISP